jgi:hypothetical protein
MRRPGVTVVRRVVQTSRRRLRRPKSAAIIPPRAEFEADDPQDVVDAAFACPMCVTGQAGIPRLVSSAQRWSWATYACCRCTRCSATWAMTLDVVQTLRITGIHESVPADRRVIWDSVGVSPYCTGR